MAYQSLYHLTIGGHVEDTRLTAVLRRVHQLSTWATKIVDSAISHRGEETDQHTMIDGKKLQIFAEWKDSSFELTMQVFCDRTP
jgi:hypothetical protein